MCGGIGYNIKYVPIKELKKFYSQKQIDVFQKTGELQTFFWSAKPVLPIVNKGKIELKSWGNRQDEISLPKTGWAKIESIDEGKWAYLKPVIVKILANRGYEKGVWFEIKKGGLKGILVKKDDQERIYMITKSADHKYLKLTKHIRQPIEY